MNDITALMATMKPGKYAILYRDNWDGEGDTYHCLASLGDDGTWHDEEFNAELLQYEGDAILKAWPLDDGSNVLALVEALEKAQSQSSKWLEAYHKAVSVGARYEERIAELESRQPDLYLCRVKGDEELYSPCGKDYPRGRGYFIKPPHRTVTVKLPEPLMPAHHNSGELFMTPDNVIHGGYLNRDDVLRNLRAAGIQVIEGEHENG